MKCIKCNSNVVKSKFSNWNGFETYKCSNIECNYLHDINDFNKGSCFQIKKPKELHPYHVDLYDEFVKNRSVNIPIGGGKSLFCKNILECNNALLIVPSKIIEQNFKDSIVKKRVLCIHSLIRKFRSDQKFLKEYDFFIIDELYSTRSSVSEFLKDNICSKKCYYINKKTT